jgi:hypothetical protein
MYGIIIVFETDIKKVLNLQIKDFEMRYDNMKLIVHKLKSLL